MPKDWQKEEGPSSGGPDFCESSARSGSPERLSDANAQGTLSGTGEAVPSASSSNTHLASSHSSSVYEEIARLVHQQHEEQLLDDDGFSGPINDVDFFPDAVAAIDWLEESMLVSWDDITAAPLLRMVDLLESARAKKAPEQYELAGQLISVQPLGIGSDRQQRLEFRLEWPGVMLAFSRFGGGSRQHANLLLRVTGEGCLLSGALPVRELAKRMVADLGGVITDSWLRRIDLCLDLPGMSLEDWILPAFEKEQFVTTATRWNPWDGRLGCTGITVGNPKSVILNIYDKLRDSKKHSELYLEAMRLHRWGDEIPSAAVRVEYQVRKSWLDPFGLTRTEYVLEALPAILSRLTELEKRPFFALKSSPVDRKNKHQGRVSNHPEWVRLVATFRSLIGSPANPLTKVDRGQLSCLRACQMIVGYATSFAAQTGRLVEGPEDLLSVVKSLLEINDVSEEDLRDKWAQKALKFGLLHEPESFDFGENVRGGATCS